MLEKFIFSTIQKSLDFKPTEGQEVLLKKLSEFVPQVSDIDIFLLKGYAGTGKTSIIGALVKTFKELKQSSVLLAPTGRAAKVLSKYSRKKAYTIHKQIYRQQSSSDGFGRFVTDKNLNKNTFFIVDEASMISNTSYDNSIFGTGRLLDDLINYVFDGIECKLIIVGDTAQLPPVKLDISPALDKEYLSAYGLNVEEFELTEVVRQKKSSGILHNATELRKQIKTNPEDVSISLKTFGFNDFIKIDGNELIELISDSYNKNTEKETIVVCRSNKRANRYNAGIRNSVLFREDEISVGDMLMIVKNNYFWAEEIKETDFIANGDVAEIIRIKGYTERYNFRFADVLLRFPDYNDAEIDLKIILDTLMLDAPSLNSAQNKEFYHEIEKDYENVKNKRKRYEKIREDEYFNALQVKYAYAVTCHKAQGGQWKKVFVDQGWLNDEMINTEYLRWLYTAITRATETIYLVNFSKEFFTDEE